MSLLSDSAATSAVFLDEQAFDSAAIVRCEGEGSQTCNTQFCMNFTVFFCWNDLLHKFVVVVNLVGCGKYVYQSL